MSPSVGVWTRPTEMKSPPRRPADSERFEGEVNVFARHEPADMQERTPILSYCFMHREIRFKSIDIDTVRNVSQSFTANWIVSIKFAFGISTDGNDP